MPVKFSSGARGWIFVKINAPAMQPESRALPDDIRAIYPFAPHYFETGAGRIHYVDEGTGPVVVMLHGNPTWSFYFRDLIKLLSPHFRCIVPDHLGCGLSDKPQDFTYRLRDRVDHVRALLAELKVEHYDVVAHDWGGAIAMGVATLEPEKVGKIVLMNTGAFLSKDIPKTINLCRVPWLGEFMLRRLNVFARAATVMTVKKPLPDVVKAGYLFPYDSFENRIAVARFVQDIPMTPDHPSYSELSRIDQQLRVLGDKPIFLPWGGADFCFTPKFFEEFRRRFPQAETLMEPGSGHYLLEDSSTIVPLAIRNFLLG